MSQGGGVVVNQVESSYIEGALAMYDDQEDNEESRTYRKKTRDIQ